jgi:hypothetical protein
MRFWRKTRNPNFAHCEKSKDFNNIKNNKRRQKMGFPGFNVPAPSNDITQEEIYQMISMLVGNNHIPQSLDEVKLGIRHHLQKTINDGVAQDIINRVNAELQPAQPAQPIQQNTPQQPIQQNTPQQPIQQNAPQQPIQQNIPNVSGIVAQTFESNQPIQQSTPPTPTARFNIPPIPGQTVTIPPIPAELQQQPESSENKEDFKASVIAKLKAGEIPAKWENIEAYYKSCGKRCGQKTAQKVLDESGMAQSGMAQSGMAQSGMVQPVQQTTQPIVQSVQQAAQTNPGENKRQILFINCMPTYPAKAYPRAVHILLPIIQQIEQTLQIADYRQTPDKSGIMGVCNAIKSNLTILPKDLVVTSYALPRDVINTLRTLYDHVVESFN